MALTVLDSSNLDAILADARGEAIETVEEKAIAKLETKEIKDDEHHEDEPDDIEGDDGLTPRQKRELTSKMLKSIGKKHRQVKEAEEFAAAQYNERKMAETRAAGLERALEELKGQAKPEEKAEPETRPQRQNFGTEDEYIEALADWKTEQKFAQREAEAQRKASEERQQEIINAAKARIEKAVELVPDFKDVTSSVDVAIPDVIARYMQRSELFAELGYHFAKNPEIVSSLAKLQSDEMLVQVGKIESKLKPFSQNSESHDEKSSKDTPSNGKQKTAPSEDTGKILSKPRTEAPVIKPLNESGNAANEIDPDKIRDVISDFAKRNQINFNKRKRH